MVYKDKYLAEFTIRYDGSMNFAQGHRWGVFPSVSAAWVISQEDFFEPLLNVVNFFKIKGSWGMWVMIILPLIIFIDVFF